MVDALQKSEKNERGDQNRNNKNNGNVSSPVKRAMIGRAAQPSQVSPRGKARIDYREEDEPDEGKGRGDEYIKDGFVVDDDEGEEEENEDEQREDEYYEYNEDEPGSRRSKGDVQGRGQ